MLACLPAGSLTELGEEVVALREEISAAARTHADQVAQAVAVG
jgi:hypothetical protein